MSDEEYVRGVWEEANAGDDAAGVLAGPYWVCIYDRKRWFYGHTEADAWSAAAEFTRNRLEQIKQVEEEIRLLQSMVILLRSEPMDATAPVYRRTIARLEAALAELRKGMKEQGRV
jgi:hypothetical protein